jgi:hypothetical protein
MRTHVACGTLCLSLLAAAAVPPVPASGQEALPPELDAVRTALEKYRDPIAAVRDGYLSTIGCVHYEDGAMGVHFLNMGLVGPTPDPMRPPILIYEPNGDAFELVAAEWLVPLATGVDKVPELFGRTFDGPMEGHEPLMPAGLHHYDLHAWLFRPNPAGVFNAVNPDVDCSGAGVYALAEAPPRMVTHSR